MKKFTSLALIISLWFCAELLNAQCSTFITNLWKNQSSANGINKVTINGTDVTLSNGGVNDLTSNSYSLDMNTMPTLSITKGSGSFNRFRVFVDWDGNGSFDQDNERGIQTSSDPGSGGTLYPGAFIKDDNTQSWPLTFSTNLTIPEGTYAGTKLVWAHLYYAGGGSGKKPNPCAQTSGQDDGTLVIFNLTLTGLATKISSTTVSLPVSMKQKQNELIFDLTLLKDDVTCRLCNANGFLIAEQKLIGGSEANIKLNYTKGVYLVQLVSTTGVFVQKVIIR